MNRPGATATSNYVWDSFDAAVELAARQALGGRDKRQARVCRPLWAECGGQTSRWQRSVGTGPKYGGRGCLGGRILSGDPPSPILSRGQFTTWTCPRLLATIPSSADPHVAHRAPPPPPRPPRTRPRRRRDGPCPHPPLAGRAGRTRRQPRRILLRPPPTTPKANNWRSCDLRVRRQTQPDHSLTTTLPQTHTRPPAS